MNDLKFLKDLAHKSRDNSQDRIACYVELLEAHIETQNQLLETFQQELDQIIIELSQEQA
jgi:hemerythrin-like domain-containing protein